MADHINCVEQGDQPLGVMRAQAGTARISLRKLLQSLEPLRIDKTRIKPLETESGKTGGNADVVQAELEPTEPSMSSAPAETQYVAVKKFRLGDNTGDTRVLAVSIKRLPAYSPSPDVVVDCVGLNIVKIIGFVEDTNAGIAWMILPWEKNGNLREFIRSGEWEFPERFALLHDVANGIEFLHSRKPSICHGDLKSLNILVSSDYHAVLTDFGSARSWRPVSSESRQVEAEATNMMKVAAAANPNTTSPKTKVLEASEAVTTLSVPAGTLRWTAPEILSGELLAPGLASDIWAFGWVCWEVMTGDFPFDGESDSTALLQIMEGELPIVRGDARVNQVVAFSNLITECWNQNPSHRPNASACERQIFWQERDIPSSPSGSEPSKIRSARLLFSLGCMHLRHSRIDEAAAHFRQSIDVARSTSDSKALATAMRGMGRVYLVRGELPQAEQSLVAARDILSRIGDQSGLAYTVKALGELYHLRGEYSRAEESSTTALNIFLRIEDQSGFAWAAKALGDAYHLGAQFSKAEGFYITSRDVFSQVGNQLGLANAFNGLGRLYADQKDDTRAEQSYREAQEISSTIGEKYLLANSLRSMGCLRLSQCRYEEAEGLVSEASTLYKEAGLEKDVLGCDEFLEKAKIGIRV